MDTDPVTLQRGEVEARYCRVAEWREGGGSSMPWTWTECRLCGANQEGSKCRLTEDDIAQRLSVKLRAERDLGRKYHESVRFARILVKELVRRERLNDVPEPPGIVEVTFMALAGLFVLALVSVGMYAVYRFIVS